MFLTRKALILLTVFLGAHIYCQAQEIDFNEAELTTFIASQLRISQVPGLAVGIIRRDRIVYLRGFGTTAGQSITPQTPFLIGSLSKSFTALAIMQLVEAGQLDLDTPVCQYLSWFRLKDLEASRTITVRHLLNQTSGLPTSAGFFTPDADTLAETELAHPVGQVYEYCNLNYKILGMLIEAVTGQTYAAYAQEHLLDPLQMRSTYLTYDDAVTRGLARGHQYVFGLPVSVSTPRYDNRNVAAGYIASSAEDMCHYLIAHLQDGIYNEHSVITPASLGLMHQSRGDIGSRYGMGWVAGEWNGLKSIWHTGLNEDFSSNMNILPERGYGIIILSNINSFTLHNDLMDGIIRRLHDQQTKSYVPYELLQRLLLLVTLLFGLAQLIRQLWKWRRVGCPLLIRLRTEVIAHLVLGIAISCVLLMAVPIWADSPLNALLGYQPDVGYGVICGAIIFTLAGIIGAFVRSKLSLAVST
ncbi:MAG TPA: serine hydrolase domain-containing protein [Pyrinomonadaceae bacterium]|nr:serine hydrolase domain-containing protein [Pyrinomonadaceae bacterium]